MRHRASDRASGAFVRGNLSGGMLHAYVLLRLPQLGTEKAGLAPVFLCAQRAVTAVLAARKPGRRVLARGPT